MNDQLYTCPCCNRKNFTARGLTAHRCDAKVKRRMTPTGPLERPKLSKDELVQALKNPQTPEKR